MFYMLFLLNWCEIMHIWKESGSIEYKNSIRIGNFCLLQTPNRMENRYIEKQPSADFFLFSERL